MTTSVWSCQSHLPIRVPCIDASMHQIMLWIRQSSSPCLQSEHTGSWHKASEQSVMQSGQKARWQWEHSRKASHSSIPLGFVARNVAMASALRRTLFNSMMSVVLFRGWLESSANRQHNEPQAAQNSGSEGSFVYGLPTKKSFAYSAMLVGCPGVGDGNDGNNMPGLWIRRHMIFFVFHV